MKLRSVALIFVGALIAIGGISGYQSAVGSSADEDSRGAGRTGVIGYEYLCESCSKFELRPSDDVFELASYGDSSGDKKYADNIIAQLEEEGCEWGFYPSSSAIFFTCPE